jgi:DNA modification methylase
MTAKKKVDPKTLVIHEKLKKMKSNVNYEKLKVTISKFGIIKPIDVVEDLGVESIVDGVRRWMAALDLGFQEVPVNYVSPAEGDVILDSSLRNTTEKRTTRELVDSVKYILEELGTSQGKKRTDFGRFDSDDDFGEVGKDRFSLAGKILDIDFSPVQLRKLIKIDDFDKKSGNLKMSLIDAIDKEGLSISRAYNIGARIELEQRNKTDFETELRCPIKENNYKLYNVDNKTAHEYLEDESIDLEYHSPDYVGGIRNYRNVDKNDQLGQKDAESYIIGLVDLYGSIRPKLKDTGSLVINISDVIRNNRSLAIPQRLTAAMIEDGWDFIQEVQWKKENPTPLSNYKGFRPSVEKMLHFAKDADKFLWRDLRYDSGNGTYDIKKSGKKFYVDSPCKNFENFLTDQLVGNLIETPVFNHKGHKDIDPDYNHQAPQSENIPLLFILHLTKPGMVVSDLFSGSGTTGAVALKFGRNFIGFDLDPENIDFMKKRYAEITNKSQEEEYHELETIFFGQELCQIYNMEQNNESDNIPEEPEYREAS